MPKQTTNQRDAHHIPVLLNAVIAALAPHAGQSYLDLTAGVGGHAQAVLDITKAPERAILVDRDPQAAHLLRQRFDKVKIINQDFWSASHQFLEAGRRFDMILADLGASSLHFDQPQRGFSMLAAGPLDMRMDLGQPLTAAEIVNGWSEADLVKILRDFGQEPKAKQVARAIILARPLKHTLQLADVVSKVVARHGRIHPATKTFQALRIAVNDELGQLSASLPLWIELLAGRGRLAVISFHSLEDRLVKQILADHSKHSYEADLKLLNQKPAVADRYEIAINPRARSAKLRAAVKIKTERTD